MMRRFFQLRALHLRIGRRGETTAIKLLRQKHYDILARNVDDPAGEIDIIARDGGIMVFIEVKTRRAVTAARPAAGLNPRQQLRIVNAARRYLRRIENPAVPYRFDLIEVRLSRFGVAELRHWQDHFSESSLRYYRRALREDG